MTLAAGYIDRKPPGGGVQHTVTTQAIAAPAAAIIDASKGDAHRLTLTAAVSATTITNGSIGQELTVEWIQGAGAPWTFAWPVACKFAGGAAPAASTVAGYSDAVTFRFDGTVWREMARSVGVR